MLFELLENAGFLKGAAINTGRIAGAKRSELVSIAEQSAELTSLPRSQILIRFSPTLRRFRSVVGQRHARLPSVA